MNTNLLNLRKISGIFAALMLTGCHNMVLMNPKGAIGESEKSLILTATLLMLIVVIPVIVMTIAFAWKYRASNQNATFAPKWAHSNKIEAVVWLIPCIIIAVLATLTWRTTHELDPYKPLASDKKPIHVQVVSLDWKWLFIYPEQHIAVINQLAFPVDTPVSFDVTSASVMNAFFIPQLGSQIYSMAGMNTKLHLVANEAGSYDGMSASYSGGGFSDMKFKALAMSDADFNDWVTKVKSSANNLDQAAYTALAKPSENAPVEYFSSVAPDLYKNVLNTFDSYYTAPSESDASHGAEKVSLNAASEE